MRTPEERAALFNAVWPDGIGGKDNLRAHIPGVEPGIRQAFLDEFDERQLKLLGVDFEVEGWIRRSILA